LWAPYQVTKVPPPDILEQEHVPPAPPVKNMTNGAVSDADAQRWANASNRDSGWGKWAEANAQVAFLRHIVGPAVSGTAQERQVLAEGGQVLQPDCNLYPTSNALYPEGIEGSAYFARKSLPSRDPYVFVVVYNGPCSETLVFPDGRQISILDFSQPTTVFVAGYFVHDSVLGDLWFTEAGGNCQDSAAPPPQWCGR
jgi:hypothetical protein